MSDSLPLHPQDFLSQLPLPATDRWPDGVFDIEVLEQNGLTLELFAPRGTDHQSPHDQDELYVVIAGSAVLDIDGATRACAAGDAIFVPARVAHRFEGISPDFATWAIFWGPRRA